MILLTIWTIYGNLYCNNKNCTSCSQGYLTGPQCLSQCPTGYLYNSTLNSCSGKGSTLYSVLFSTQQNYTNNTIASFITYNLTSFDDPSRINPIPTKERGFYFANTSSLQHRFYLSLGYQFSVDFAIRILQPGVIFELLDEYNTQYITTIATETDIIIK